MPQLYDITRTLSPAIAVWPGDSSFSTTQQSSLEAGDMVNVYRLAFSAHTGTHIDAPWHTEPQRVHPADLDLTPFIGPARVVTITRREGGITPADLARYDLAGVQRLLLHTWYSDEIPDERFDEGFVYPTPELMDWLADQGGLLLGVDMPSVDPFGSSTLEGHHRQFARGLRNIENLFLRGVPDGAYELIALPLKIAGVCGCPVRAILRSLE
ncbi:MAG: cyclase family protein [Anaerolineae bacterium]|nr:cyclase family protein [Anaerolineae bacterium]